MPLKELTPSEEIKILEELRKQETVYDKNLALVKGDIYSLKHTHNIDVEPKPLDLIQEVYRQHPTIEAIKAVSRDIRHASKKEPPVVVPRPVIPAPTPKEEPVVPPEPLETATVKSESGEDALLRKHKIPTPKEIEDGKLDIAQVVVAISHYNKNVLGSQLAKLTKKGQKDSAQYQEIQNDIQFLKNYKSRLLDVFDRQRVLLENIGTGVMKFGKYYASVADLKKGTLKIRKKNKSKVKQIPDMQVSEGVKQLILKRYDPKKSYTKQDCSHYRQICDLTGHRPKKYSKLWDRIYVTNVHDAQQRLLNALGELKAGNTHVEVTNEIVELCDFLLKSDKLSRDEYRNLMQLINNG